MIRRVVQPDVKLSEYSGEFFLGNIQVKGSDMDGWKVIIFLIQKSRYFRRI